MGKTDKTEIDFEVCPLCGRSGEPDKKKPEAESSVPKRLFDIKEAAHYLGRSVWAIRELYYKGALECVRAGRRMHFDVEDLDKWIEDHKEHGDL